MTHFGYHGVVLHIDLSSQTVTREEPDDVFWRTFAGGGLLATYYLQKLHPGPGDAFDPTNPLIFTSSVVAGHPYAGLARFTAAGRSPLTGGVGETRGEGPFGVALKGSGADSLVIQGQAATPTVLLVEDGQVTFHPADDLWGLMVAETADRLEARFGPEIHTAIIGPAGERQVRYASIVTDRAYQAPRMGLGAVMGAKRVKAIVLRGDCRPPVADPAACAALTESYRARMVDNPLTRWQLEPPGFAAWVHTHGTDTALCTHNYRESVFAAADAYRPELFMARYRHDGDCPGCPNRCIKFFSVDAGDTPSGGIHQEITGALGSNLGIADLDVLFRANVLCNQLGLDPTSLGFTLSMAMECVAEGVLDPAQVGADLRFGNGAAVLEMIPRIARREGFGDVLAEGAARAAAAIGGAAPRYALHVKGLEMVPFEPRTQTNLALGYAVAPIGPRYDICEHDWDYDPHVGWPHSLDHSRTVGILERVPMQHLGVDKVRNFKALLTLWSAADALDLCVFAVAPTRVFSLHEMAELLAVVTGWDASSYEIMRLGERRLHLMAAYNRGAGLSAADDTLPDRFFDDPIPSGAWAGTRLDRAQFGLAVRTFYRMMGWDDAGHPRPETLLDHRLERIWGAA